jgi:hypothetical protein
MKRETFVLRLAPETEPLNRHFEGWIEHVDTGEELRFRSTDELLSLLGVHFKLAQRQGKPEENDENTPDSGQSS